MRVQRSVIRQAYWMGTALALAGAIGVLLGYTPDETTMGPIQKIFYLHLPMAINTFLACLMVFIASIGYLWQRNSWWDDLADAAARVAVLLCSGVLITGMIWGKSAWGQWWTWSPRLTFSLMLWLLYVVYLVIRSSIESSQRRAVVGAVYGITAFLDVPLVWLSARLMPDIHPGSVSLSFEMKLTLARWFLPVTLMAAGLIIGRFGLNRRLRFRGRQFSDGELEPVGLRVGEGMV
ncbi:MAG: cytochrome c biogenesis protein [Bacillota bacterium]